MSLDIPASRSALVLERLSSAAKITFESTPKTAGDIVCMRLSDVPLSVVMEKLAKAQGASWARTENGYRLVRTADDEKRERESELVLRTKAFERGQEELRKQNMQRQMSLEAQATQIQAVSDTFRNLPRSLRAVEMSQNLRSCLPLPQAVAKIALATKAEQFAGMPAHQEFFYSNIPKRGQSRLPAAWQAIIKDSLAQHEKLVLALKDKRISSKVERGDAVVGIPFLAAFEAGQEPPKGARVLLGIYRFPANGGQPGRINLRLQVAGKNGLPVVDGHSVVAAIPEPVAEGGDKAMVEVPDELLSFTSSIRAYRRGPQPDSEAFKRVLLQPEQRDPLDLVVAPMLRQLAKARKANLIACLPDQAFTTALPPGGNTGPASTFIASLRRLTMMEVEEHEGWIEARPNEAQFARLSRIDRAGLGSLLRASDSLGAVPLDALAAFFLKHPNLENTWNELPAAAVGCLVAGSTFNQRAYGWMRWYGLLSPSQKAEMGNNGMMPLQRLAPNQVRQSELAIGLDPQRIFPFAGGRQVVLSDQFAPRFFDETFAGFQAPEGVVKFRRTSIGEPVTVDGKALQQWRLSYQIQVDPSHFAVVDFSDFKPATSP